MGDVRYASYYERLRSAADPAAAIRELSDEGVIAALAAASERQDPYLANVLATEALNRVSRARAVSDSIAEGVYALDMRGRVTFMNPRAETLLGWKFSEVVGRRMHDVIHTEQPDGTKVPDGSCSVIQTVESGEMHDVPEDWFRKRDGTFMPVSYTAVPIQREDAVVGTVVTFHDETQRRRHERALHSRLQIESTVAHVASLLVSATDVDAALDVCLEEIGRVSGAHRAYLFVLRGEPPAYDNTHEWCAPGVESHIRDLQNIPPSAVPWWTAKMQRGEVVNVENVDALPPEADAERELLASQGIRSLLAFPVHVRGEYVGFMGLDDVESAEPWAPEDLRLLSITAANVGTALERTRVAHELESRAARQAALARFGQDALRTRDLQAIMDEAVRVIARTLDVPLCNILELERDEAHLRLRAGVGWDPERVGDGRVDAGTDSQAGFTLRSDKPVIVEDLSNEDRFRGPPLLRAHGVVSGLSVVIRGAERAWGVLGAHTTRPRTFTTDEVNFVQAMANALGAALERAASERARRANEARFERIIEDVPAGLVIYNEDGTVEFANPTAEEILGANPRGRPFTRWTMRYADGTPIPLDERPFMRVKRSGKAVRGVEAWLHQPDGAGHFLTANLVPLTDGKGQLTGVLAAFTDATELQRQRERLLELQRLQEEIVENVPAGVLYLDREGRITYENAYLLKALGAPDGDAGERVQGKRIFDLPTMEGHGEFLDKVNGLLERGEPFHEHEETYRSAYGREAVLVVSGVPLFHDDTEGRRVKGGILLVRDVTTSRRAEADVRRLNAELERRVADRTRALEAANEELEAFSFSVSHDIRAPLRGIEYFTRVLEEDYAERLDRAGHDYLERLRSESSRLTTLVNDLLEFSRAGREELRREHVDVTDVAEEVVQQIAESDPARKVDVKVAPDLHAFADPRLLRVILDNLLSNAWKFTSRTRDPHIEVGETTVDGNGRAFFVKDNGAGFDPEKARELFVPFKRLHAQTEFKGTGVGLATVARIVHRHGGETWADGEPGKGATFYFTLPDGSPP